jgi:hypothetical protein
LSAARILVLSSIAPNYAHFRAGQTVLAHLLEELAKGGLGVRYAVAEPRSHADPASQSRLEQAGAKLLPGPPPELAAVRPGTRIMRGVNLVREAIDPSSGRDDLYFTAPDVEADRLISSGADAAILFWDTAYEQVAEVLTDRGMPVFGYLARPPFASAQATLPQRRTGLRRHVEALRLNTRARRHFSRLRRLTGAGNICALDAAWYSREGVACRYLPNTWPDPAGDDWASVRTDAERRRSGVHILGNIGGLNATGNSFGMAYLTDHVLPLLDRHMSGMEWTVNICGRFEVPPELARLTQHRHVALRGFVADIDDEVAGNHIFLILNNAGPYTGGYTRVIYAFATGACVIAHRRLADSMPELVGGENCLLGETPQQIAGLIREAAADPELRSRIGAAARTTYVEYYHPQRIAAALRDMITEREH